MPRRTSLGSQAAANHTQYTSIASDCVGINARLDRMSREMGEVSSAVKSGDRARAGQTIGIQKRTIAKRKSGRNDLGGIEGTAVRRRRRNEEEEEQPRRPVKRRRTLPIVSRSYRDEDGIIDSRATSQMVPPWLFKQLNRPAPEDSLSKVNEDSATAQSSVASLPPPPPTRFDSSLRLASAQSSVPRSFLSHQDSLTQPSRSLVDDSKAYFPDLVFATNESLPLTTSTTSRHFPHQANHSSYRNIAPYPYSKPLDNFPMAPPVSTSPATVSPTPSFRPPSRTPYQMESAYNAVPAFERAAQVHSPSTFSLSKNRDFQSYARTTPPATTPRLDAQSNTRDDHTHPSSTLGITSRAFWRPPQRDLSPTPGARAHEHRLAESKERSNRNILKSAQTALDSFKQDLSARHDRFKIALSSDASTSMVDSASSTQNNLDSVYLTPTAPPIPPYRQYPAHTQRQSSHHPNLITPTNRPLPPHPPRSSPLSFTSSVQNDENLPPPRSPHDNPLQHHSEPHSAEATVDRSLTRSSSNESATLTTNSISPLPPSPTPPRPRTSVSVTSMTFEDVFKTPTR